MADHTSDTLPRLADALVEVGTRLGEIGAELHALRLAADAPAPHPSGSTPTSAEKTLATSQSLGARDRADENPDAVHETGSDHTGGTPDTGSHTPGVAAAGPQAGSDRPLGAPGSGHGAAVSGGVPTGAGHIPWYPPPVQPPPPGPTLWERMSRDGAGARILAWAGGVVTLAGVVLLLVLAIQRGYLGPLPRVLLGAGLGVALAGIGGWLHRSPAARTGAYALAATGIAVLYLDVVAATALYGFLPPWGGLLAGLAVTAGGVAVAGRWDSQLLAVFVVVCCAASAPVITGGFDALLIGFLLVLLAGTTPVQLARRWSGLSVAAAVPPVIACVVLIATAADRGLTGDTTMTAVLAGVTSGVVIVLATATAIRRPDDDITVVTLFLAPLPGLLAAVLLPRVGASVLPAAVGALLIGVWALGYRTPLPRGFAPAAGGIGTLALLQATATAFDGDARAIAFLTGALILAVLAERLRLPAALLPAGLFGALGLVLGLASPANPALVTRPSWPAPDTAAAVSLGLTGVVLSAVAIAFCWAIFRLDLLRDAEHGSLVWVPAGLLALYGSTAALVAAGLLVSPDRDGFLLGHVLVTVAWTVLALALLLRGIDSVPLRVAGLSLVVAALAKLVLFDLSSLDGMARVAAFLVAGLVLLGAGARYARLVAARTR
jgi:uncharacterized membrane protein